MKMDSLAFATIDATDATDATEFVLVCDVFWVDWGNRETDLLALARTDTAMGKQDGV
jgi:hypothetical protein